MSESSSNNKKNLWYTGKGDAGTSTLYHSDGSRITKGADVFEVLGVLDELNSYLGICKSKEGLDGDIEEYVHNIQEKLFIIQAEVAGADKNISKDMIVSLEKKIADVQEELPEIHSFSIPGATETGAMFDYARTLARKAERMVVRALDSKDIKVSEQTLAYLNRLSSVLFAFARKINHEQHVPEQAPTYEGVRS